MNETYGYNMTKYSSYLLSNRQHCECIIEIYHEGDMVKDGEYNLAGKLDGTFATANYVHGGADIAMQCALLHLMI